MSSKLTDAEFRASLKRASEIVASWPKWKRDLLASIFMTCKGCGSSFNIYQGKCLHCGCTEDISRNGALQQCLKFQ